jgi:hypothetical protein
MTTRRSVLFALPFSLWVLACGGDKEQPKIPEKEAALDDAFALLPSNPIAIGTVDARSFFGSKTFGAELGKALEKYMPLGEEAGFSASRDVDRVTWASYSYQGIDAVGVVIGRFDEAKIKAVAAGQTATKSGVPLVASQYAGRDVYTISNVGFTLLSSTHAVVGTEGALRRVLDRIRDKRVNRDVPAWMIQTVETPSASAAVAADFASQPVPAEVLKRIPVTFVQNVKAARAVTLYKDQETQLAGSDTYPDAQAAEQAAAGIKNMSRYIPIAGAIGIQIKNFDVKVEKADVQITVAIDDQSLQRLIGLASGR